LSAGTEPWHQRAQACAPAYHPPGLHGGSSSGAADIMAQQTCFGQHSHHSLPSGLAHTVHQVNQAPCLSLWKTGFFPNPNHCPFVLGLLKPKRQKGRHQQAFHCKITSRDTVPKLPGPGKQVPHVGSREPPRTSSSRLRCTGDGHKTALSSPCIPRPGELPLDRASSQEGLHC
jgi:hypothetical protein